MKKLIKTVLFGALTLTPYVSLHSMKNEKPYNKLFGMFDRLFGMEGEPFLMQIADFGGPKQSCAASSIRHQSISRDLLISTENIVLEKLP
jgi:hypothetical protein